MKIEVWAGTVSGTVVKAVRNRTPSRARASRLGVSAQGVAVASEPVGARRVSIVITTTGMSGQASREHSRACKRHSKHEHRSYRPSRHGLLPELESE